MVVGETVNELLAKGGSVVGIVVGRLVPDGGTLSVVVVIVGRLVADESGLEVVALVGVEDAVEVMPDPSRLSSVVVMLPVLLLTLPVGAVVTLVADEAKVALVVEEVVAEADALMDETVVVEAPLLPFWLTMMVIVLPTAPLITMLLFAIPSCVPIW